MSYRHFQQQWQSHIIYEQEQDVFLDAFRKFIAELVLSTFLLLQALKIYINNFGRVSISLREIFTAIRML